MITSGMFIDTCNDSQFRAEVLRSLAEAADLVMRGEVLADKEKRTNIGLHVIAAIRFLSEDLANTTGLLADAEERDAMQNPLKGWQCTCGAKGEKA